MPAHRARALWAPALMLTLAAGCSRPTVHSAGGPAQALIQAAVASDIAGASALLSASTDPNATDPQGKTALFYAAALQDPEMGALLLDAGANPNLAAPGGGTPLHAAVAAGHRETVSMLLQKGADPNLPDSRGRTAVFDARTEDVVNLLKSFGADLNHQDHQGLTPLDNAVLSRAQEVSTTLIRSGGQGRVKDAATLKAFFDAVKAGDDGATIAFLAEGVDPDTQDPHQWTALFWAPDEDTAATLLAAGADPNFQSPRDGLTPLHLAARQGRLDVTQHLLASGANPGLSSHQGATPLHLAAATGNTAIAQTLLSASATTTATDKEGRTPATRAREAGHHALGDLLSR